MSIEEKNLVESLLFYVEILADKQKTKNFHEELDKLGLTHDYFFRTIDKARQLKS